MLVHLVARTRHGVRPFATPDLAWELWSWLGRGTPDAVAACLMPNHLHQIEDAPDVEAARRSLASRLAAFARKHGYGHLWQPLPDPQPIADLKHLARQIRYVHLNPCRGGLVPDPLCWPWSTHRGAIGAAYDPWVGKERVAAVLKRRPYRFAEWFHGYVSSDPDVAIDGTPLPVPARSSSVTDLPLGAVIEAARAAAPRDNRAFRRIAVALARDQGWRDATQLASALDVTPSTVRRLAQQPDPRLLHLGRLYLGDARLRYAPRP